MFLTRRWQGRQKLVCGLLVFVMLTAGPLAVSMARSTVASAASYTAGGSGYLPLSDGSRCAPALGYAASDKGSEAHTHLPDLVTPPKAPVITTPHSVWLIIGGIAVAFATWAIAFNYLRCGKWRC